MTASADRAREWRKSNPDSVKKWIARNPTRWARIMLRRRLKLHGLSIDQYVALLKSQRGRCAICRVKLDESCVDHCHKTSRVRGILCHHCNKLLGFAKDKVKILQQAVKYLESV